jgi:cellulose synthase/poly-beta-1,6-N-acetylglucosamine synthase-like glycosyltransferase
MINAFEITYAILLFWAIYFQVFFLVVFFEKRDKIHENDIVYRDNLYPSISFLIPCWNEENTLLGTIQSILASDYPKDKLKIIAIDDGSTDKTWERLSELAGHPQITILKKENGGKHTALNLALKQVKTDLVASFDADTKIDPQALKNAVSYFIKDNTLMALGGAVLIDNPQTIVQKAQSVEYQMFSFSKKILGFIGGVFVVPGAFSIFRTKVFKKIGGYKKAYNLEDVELTMRLQEAGMKVDHCHTAFVSTKGPDSLKKLFKQRLRWSYGFILNVRDYYKLILNKKYGNFGLFTLPMNIFAPIIILFVFFLGVYRLVLFISQKIVEINLVGFNSINLFNWDMFFTNTQPTNLLAISMYVFIILSIYLGKRISKVKTLNLSHIFYFMIIYSILPPLWILKSIYNTATAKAISWR